MIIFQTPDKKWKMILISVIGYLMWPISEYIWYSHAQKQGEFPVNADTISIPLFQSFFGWLLLLPFYGLVVWLSIRKYSGNINIFVWLKNKHLWTIFWTMFWSIIVIFEFSELFRSIGNTTYIDILFWVIQIWLAISFRALLVYQKKN